MDATEFYQGRYFKVADLDGKELTLTISSVEKAEFSDGEVKPAVFFKGERKGLTLNKTNLETCIDIAGTTKMDNWTGTKITLFPSTVRFNGVKMPCIRVKAPQQPNASSAEVKAAF